MQPVTQLPRQAMSWLKKVVQAKLLMKSRVIQCSQTTNCKREMPMQRKTALFTKETKADTFYFVYCLLHVPITVLIDSSLAIPREYQPQMQQMIIKFHVSTNKDFLLQSPPVWLVVFGWIELVFQLPFFFIAAYALYKRMLNFECFHDICHKY